MTNVSKVAWARLDSFTSVLLDQPAITQKMSDVRGQFHDVTRTLPAIF